MDEVVCIENLSKVYKRPIKIDGKSVKEDFWALSDVSLSVNQGDVLGVIGKNGAGKSTLLKILSKITSPTSGKITLKGRVGSLLEVGTGFHPEMTGRENIFMNGNILGMSNAEINSKMEEIVDFSGVANFLETPVKRYSSGMQTRLAFAVAAHLEPEILIIDEVLAVGDVEFQKKCLGKMKEIGTSGRTILFVSHNLDTIRNLCNRCIWLKDGQLASESKDTSSVINKYLDETLPQQQASIWIGNRDNQSHADSNIIFKSIRLVTDKNDVIKRNIHGDQEVSLEIKFECLKEYRGLQIGFALYDNRRNLILMSYQNDPHNVHNINFGAEEYIATVSLPVQILNEGDYSLQLLGSVIGSHPILSRVDSNITINFSIDGNAQRSNHWNHTRPTMVSPILRWRISQ